MVQGKTIGERTFSLINCIFMIILMAATFYPFYYAVINSLNDGTDLNRGFVLIAPRIFSIESWKTVLSDNSILQAFWITSSRTAFVTVGSTMITSMFAYAYSRSYLSHRRIYTILGFTSMYFSGGIIPTFLLISWLGLYDHYLVYIIPVLFGGFWNVIIYNSNFKALPDSLFESAKLDGANEYRIYWQIVLPLSKPVIAALCVFTAVGTWNDYMTTLFYTQAPNLQTLQYFILQLVQSQHAIEQLQSSAMANNPVISELLTGSMGSGPVTAKTLELASMVLASIPMIVMYPFAQKYFVKGVLIGSVKG